MMEQNEQVPDHFEDPDEVAEREAKKMFKKSYNKHAYALAEASAWYVCWKAYAQNPESPEIEPVDNEELIMSVTMKNEYLMLEILSELKKLNANFKRIGDKIK